MTQTELFDYQAEAQQTKSTAFHGDLVSRQTLINTLSDSIRVLQDLDRIKKALFYGKSVPALTAGSRTMCEEYATKMPTDIVHGIIGKATEAGELLEALFDSLIYKHKLDTVNVAEEIGDGLWYDAILLEAIGSNFETVQRVNIEKLRARFPNKFQAYDAEHRNLKAERAILEGKNDSAFDSMFGQA